VAALRRLASFGGRRVLEMGCGDGRLTVGMAADGATVHLHRAAQRPWDTDIDVWLDPADHHLPRRWQLQLRGNGRRLVFERAAATP